ncbi:MAG: deoxyribonuclease V [Phycisphaerae bacterium]|nr:deoxyribonuclease V [Phycisphaerae bacterium]MDD5380467.1 deoxyribonuclease V [Phycisphaerae bacterium]
MKIKSLHNWNLSYPQAIALQKSLSGKVQRIELRKQPKTIAGIDCAFSGDKKKIFACVVLLKLPDFELIETAGAVQKLTFPYIPGLLSFREAPACIAAVKKLKHQPDAFIIDGQGIAHPRRFGLACHLGLFFDKPTVGCAKSRLTGSFEEPSPEKGSFSLLKDGRETIGAVVRTRTNVKPVFVSVGNKCSLRNAIEIILNCTTRYRIPEPTRLAHQFVSMLKLKT